MKTLFSMLWAILCTGTFAMNGRDVGLEDISTTHSESKTASLTIVAREFYIDTCYRFEVPRSSTRLDVEKWFYDNHDGLKVRLLIQDTESKANVLPSDMLLADLPRDTDGNIVIRYYRRPYFPRSLELSVATLTCNGNYVFVYTYNDPLTKRKFSITLPEPIIPDGQIETSDKSPDILGAKIDSICRKLYPNPGEAGSAHWHIDNRHAYFCRSGLVVRFYAAPDESADEFRESISKYTPSNHTEGLDLIKIGIEYVKAR